MEAEETPAKKKRRKKNEVTRKSRAFEDAELCTLSRTWLSLFKDNLSDFETFDAHLNSGFADNWMLQIDALEGHETDETVVDGLENTTQTVKEKCEALQKQTDRVEYYVKEAFPDNERVWQEFGFQKMNSLAHTTTMQLVLNGYTINMLLADYNTELTNAGMPATLPGEYELACDKIGEQAIFQEYEKRMRIRKTTKRILLFNALLTSHLKVNKAAKVIYARQPEMAGQFEK